MLLSVSHLLWMVTSFSDSGTVVQQLISCTRTSLSVLLPNQSVQLAMKSMVTVTCALPVVPMDRTLSLSRMEVSPAKSARLNSTSWSMPTETDVPVLLDSN